MTILHLLIALYTTNSSKDFYCSRTTEDLEGFAKPIVKKSIEMIGYYTPDVQDGAIDPCSQACPWYWKLDHWLAKGEYSIPVNKNICLTLWIKFKTSASHDEECYSGACALTVASTNTF